jgi:hypothetical protein
MHSSRLLHACARRRSWPRFKRHHSREIRRGNALHSARHLQGFDDGRRRRRRRGGAATPSIRARLPGVPAPSEPSEPSSHASKSFASSSTGMRSIGLHPGAGARHDDRAGQHPLNGYGIFPAIPQAGESEQRQAIGRVSRCSCLAPFSPVHSKKPLAARSLKTLRNIGLWVTDSARALNVAGTSLIDFSTSGDQAPAHRDQLPRPAFIETDHVHDVWSARCSAMARCRGPCNGKITNWLSRYPAAELRPQRRFIVKDLKPKRS